MKSIAIGIAIITVLVHCVVVHAEEGSEILDKTRLKLKEESLAERQKLKQTIQEQTKKLPGLRKRLADQDRPLFSSGPGTGLVENPAWAANRKEVSKRQQAVEDVEYQLKDALKADLRHKEALKYLAKTENEPKPDKEEEAREKAKVIERTFRDYLVGVMDKELKIAEQVDKQVNPKAMTKSVKEKNMTKNVKEKKK